MIFEKKIKQIMFFDFLYKLYEKSFTPRIIQLHIKYMPVPVAERSKALVCGRSPAEIVGSNPTGGMDICLL